MGWIKEQVPEGITKFNEVVYCNDNKKHYIAVG